MNSVSPPTSSVRSAEIPILVSFGDETRCAECGERLRASVEALEGVRRALVDFDEWLVFVEYDPATITEETLRAVVQERGLEIEARVAHATYRLTGLD